MYSTCLHLVYVILSLAQAHDTHLTATPNGNSVNQMALLIKDVDSCIWKYFNMHTLIDSTKSIKHCFVKRKIHCIQTRSAQASKHIEIFISRNVYCTNIALENNYDYPRQLVVSRQFLIGYSILVDFIIFDFEFNTKYGTHGLILEYINNYKERNAYFYHGKRIPWTTIIDSDKVTITIKTIVYRKYKLHIFYSSYKWHWLSHFQLVNDASFEHSLDIRTHALIEFKRRSKIERFQYALFSKPLRAFSVSISPLRKSKTDLTLYDGPGRLSNVLVQLSHGSSFKIQHFKTSSFTAHLQLDMSVAGEIDKFTILIRVIGSAYPLCNMTDKLHISVESSQNENTICRLYSRTYKASMNLKVNTFIFDGAKTGLSNSLFDCQYGGIVFTPFLKPSHKLQHTLLKICDSRSHFTLYSKSYVFDALVIWFKGYSRGSLLASAFPSDCVQYELELLGRPIVTYNMRFIIDDRAYCVRYICPPLQSSYQKYCHFSLKTKGGSLGIVKIVISQTETINTCIPEYHSARRKHVAQLYGAMVNNWPIGNKETFNLTRVINRKSVIFFKYLINGEVSLPYFCSANNKRKQMSIMLFTSICHRNRITMTRFNYHVNNMQAVTKDCYAFMFTLKSNVNELLMKEDTRSKTYKGVIIKSSYGTHCPNRCRHHTIVVRVLDKSSNSVYEYTSNVGEKINTLLYHYGMHITVIPSSKSPCKWKHHCNVEIYFDMNYLDDSMPTQTRWEYDSKFYRYYNRQ